MKFVISTTPSHINNKIALTKFGKFYYWVDDRVTVEQTTTTLRFWFGVSWPIPLNEVSINNITNQNGSWFYGEITRTTAVVFTDLCADYPIYYSTKNNEIIISTIFNIFDPLYFTLNKSWVFNAVHENYYQHVFRSEVNRTNREMHTAIDQVNKLPHCGKLEANAINNNIFVGQYLNRFQSYKDASLLPKIKNINEYVSNKLDQNMQAIVSQHPEKKLGVGASTGIDSLNLLEWLVKTDTKFSMYSYCFEDSPISKQYKKNVENMQGFLQDKGIKTSYFGETRLTFFDNFLSDKWIIPTPMDDLALETFVATTTLPEVDYLIKGSGGDECFLHRQTFAMLFFGVENQLTYQEAVTVCKGHYAYQEPWSFFNEYQYNHEIESSQSLIDILNYMLSLKPFTYLSTDQVLLNKPIFSPFCDIDLFNITARMNNHDMARSMLDAAPQVAYLKYMRPFLNQYKYGEYDIHSNTFPISDKFVELMQILNDQLKLLNLPTLPIHNNLKCGDIVSYNAVRPMQLGAWIHNWKNGNIG